ncbi:hypothetical protein ACWCQL_37570 [Streptomyces sp. NPDC002073]
MYGKKWAVAAAGTVLVLAGCSAEGDGGSDGATGASKGAVQEPAPAGTGALGRDAVQAEIDAAARTAALPGKGMPKSLPSGAASAPPGATQQQKLEARAAACTAGWQWMGTGAGEFVSEPGKKYQAVVTALAKTGWAEEARSEQPGAGGKGRSVRTVLTKRGWTLYATHHALKPMAAVFLNATENACMGKFTQKEMDLLTGDGEGAGAR